VTPPFDARAQRSQQALMQAGLELLNTNPEATLSDIANHAGVGRTTLYRQYENREKLITAIAVYCLERIDEVTAPIEKRAKSALDAIRLMFELTMPLTQEFQFLTHVEQLIEDDPNIVAVSEQQKKELVELVEYAQQRKEIKASLPTSWVVNLIEGLFHIAWVQQQKAGASAQEAAALAFETFCSGVAK